MKGKKGQLGNVPSIVLVFILAFVLLGVGFLLVQSMLDLDSLESNIAEVNNETGLYVNSSTATVATATTTGFNSFSVTACYCNWTGGSTLCGHNATLVAANYTVDADAGTITNASTTGYDEVMCTYTYQYGQEALKGVNSTIESFTDIPDFMGLLILVVMIGIIIAILTGIMPTGRTGTGA